MNDITVQLNERGHGAFFIKEGGEQLAEMVVHVSGGRLTVYHTEVSEKSEGKGLGKKLLNAMVAYARSHGLNVIPLCPYVHAQFKRHPEEYTDVWKKDEGGSV